MAIFYTFPDQIPVWKVLLALSVILVITAIVIVMVKRMPYLFVGWLWYSIAILPVIGIIQRGNAAMADRYHYLPSIGIAVMLAWGIPFMLDHESIQKKYLFPAGIIFLGVMATITWQQCSYWQNSLKIFGHALNVTKNNYLAHTNIASALLEEGKVDEAIYHCNLSVSIAPDYIATYITRGVIYTKLGQYQLAIENFNESIRRKPDYIEAYHKRGYAYAKFGQYQSALRDYDIAIRLDPDNANVFNDRGIIYGGRGQYQLAIEDFNQAIRLIPALVEAYNNRGFTYGRLGQYQQAIDDYNRAIDLRPGYVSAYYNRAAAYNKVGQNQRANEDWNRAIQLSRKKPEN